MGLGPRLQVSSMKARPPTQGASNLEKTGGSKIWFILVSRAAVGELD